MKYQPLFPLACAVLLCPVAFAQKPGDKPLTQADLLKQIEAITPTRPAATPAPASAPLRKDTPLPPGALTGDNDPLKLGIEPKEKPVAAAGPTTIKQPADAAPSPDQKAKGPTEITALEATFNQKANLAIFIGEVVVKDPEFNVICDKLTAHLRHDDKPKPAPGVAATATPRPITPKPGTTPKPGDPPATPKPGSLEKAIAITTSDRRVIITQDKLQADGTIKHSVGKADKATYDANTGDILLEGLPDVVQDTNRVQATAPQTTVILNRDGRMRADGPHKTTIVDNSQVR